eukprot:Pgem_evm1s5122
MIVHGIITGDFKEFSFKILSRAIDSMFIPFKFCGLNFENNEKDLKFTHNFECSIIRNIWKEYANPLQRRKVNLSANLLCFGNEQMNLKKVPTQLCEIILCTVS